MKKIIYLILARLTFDMYTGDIQPYFTETRWNYFVKHFLNQELIRDFSWK